MRIIVPSVVVRVLYWIDDHTRTPDRVFLAIYLALVLGCLLGILGGLLWGVWDGAL